MQAPRTMPGKRPATKLLPENLSDEESDDPLVTAMPSRAFEDCDDSAGSKEVDVTFAELALVLEVEAWGDAARVDVGFVDGGAIDIETAQTPSWQVAPFGQHESPHLSRGMVGSECSWFPGNIVAFCACSSQFIGDMKSQSNPAGQQSTAIADESIWRHFVDVGQQKSDGNGAPHWNNEVSPPQTESSLLS